MNIRLPALLGREFEASRRNFFRTISLEIVVGVVLSVVISASLGFILSRS